jgi:hypothetical protein
MGEDFHSFLIQGTEQIYLIHLPMFHMANHRQQLIVSAEFDNTTRNSKDKYIVMKKSSPTEPMILVTQRKTFFQEIVNNNGTFTGQMMTKESHVNPHLLPLTDDTELTRDHHHSGIILKNIEVKITSTVVSRPLNSQYRLDAYLAKSMPFYLYGNG